MEKWFEFQICFHICWRGKAGTFVNKNFKKMMDSVTPGSQRWLESHRCAKYVIITPIESVMVAFLSSRGRKLVTILGSPLKWFDKHAVILGGGAMAPPDFVRSVNPISTRGTDYAHLITTGTPGFSDLPTALQSLEILGNV